MAVFVSTMGAVAVLAGEERGVEAVMAGEEGGIEVVLAGNKVFIGEGGGESGGGREEWR